MVSPGRPMILLMNFCDSSSGSRRLQHHHGVALIYVCKSVAYDSVSLSDCGNHGAGRYSCVDYQKAVTQAGKCECCRHNEYVAGYLTHDM